MFRSTVLGKLLQPDDKRDAVHIAVAPVVCADSVLVPGQHIGFVKGETPANDEAASSESENKLGIVDPFLKRPVVRGERFWMFLYPNTITSLRHDWTHPGFVSHQAVAADSEKWLAAFAKRWNFDYGDMINEAQYGGIIVAQGNDLHGKDELGSDHDLFWFHLEVVTGKKFHPDDREKVTWSCSC